MRSHYHTRLKAPSHYNKLDQRSGKAGIGRSSLGNCFEITVHGGVVVVKVCICCCWLQYAVKVRRHRWSVVLDPRNVVHAL